MSRTAVRRRSSQAQIRAQAMEEGLLEREEEASLARAWIERRDRAARDRLVLAHRKLVIGMVRKFERHGVAFDDLFNEGVVALMIAADKFDPSTGNRFATYAQWWVLTYLQELVQRDICPVRIGRTRREKAVVRELSKARRRSPVGVVDEAARCAIAQGVGVSTSDVQKIEAALASRSLSLNSTVSGDEDGAEFVDQVADENEGEGKALRIRLEGVQARVVAQIVGQLDEREAFIIRERHLVDSPRTLRELADDLHLSSERVRQIELDSMRRLRRLLIRGGFKARDLIGAF